MIKKEKYPILEFDPDKNSIIEPRKILDSINISEYCVITFFNDVITKYLEQGKLTKVFSLRCETMDLAIYETIEI